MTTIVYRNGEIATDSRIIRHQDTIEAEYCTFGEKVHKSSCGRLYLTKAGFGYTPEMYERAAEEIIPQLRKLQHDPNLKLELSEIVTGWFETLLVVTRDSAYVIEKHASRILEGDDLFSSGSGCHLAKAALIAGQGVVEAVEITLRYDRLSGGKIHHYKASDLKPLEEVVGE